MTCKPSERMSVEERDYMQYLFGRHISQGQVGWPSAYGRFDVGASGSVDKPPLSERKKTTVFS